MILKIPKDITFSKFYKKLNLISLIFVILSLSFIFFKGLNFGVDFKGGTLIEIRTENKESNISDIRRSLIRMNLQDITVKRFGTQGDFLIKIKNNQSTNENFIQSINETLIKDLGYDVNFRRVETVGPKVSNELLKDGLLAICLSLAAMLFYIWIRFEWQFSLAAIIALIHDVFITLGLFSILSYEINLSIMDIKCGLYLQ